MKAGMIATIMCMSLTVAAQADLITLTFEPPSLPGGSKVIYEWQESGFLALGIGSMGHTDSGCLQSYPDNGSAYMQGLVLLEPFDRNIVCFDAYAVDIAEYGRGFPQPQPHDVLITGTKVGGTIVTQTVRIDGFIDGEGGEPDFETFTFDDTFVNLVALRFDPQPSTTLSFDNIVLVTVPEPVSILLLSAGGLVVFRKRRNYFGDAVPRLI